MRLIAMLLTLLIVGYLVNKQVGAPSDNQIQEVQEVTGSDAPKVPANPDELDQFGTRMDDYMEEQAEKRAAAIEAAESL